MKRKEKKNNFIYIKDSPRFHRDQGIEKISLSSSLQRWCVDVHILRHEGDLVNIRVI